MGFEQSPNETKPLGNEDQRFGLLVTTPVGPSFQSIALVTGFKPPQNPPIDWSSRENSALPNLRSRLRFTTHYALCVIDREIWESTSLSLLEKFRNAKFWEHPGDYTIMGPSRSSQSRSSATPPHMNAGIFWSDESIRGIESGEVIEQTDLSDEEITRDYLKLRQDWTYMPVFWNCHDLAIRLAHIIVRPSPDVIRFLRRLMFSLRQAYHTEINLNSTAGKCAYEDGD